MSHNHKPEADICLILEGTYPYVSGGVSSWTHELIKMHPDLTFTLVALVSPNAPTNKVYELPPNVVNLKTLRLQNLPEGKRLSPSDEKALFVKLEAALRKLQSRATISDLADVIGCLAPLRSKLGSKQLLDSPAMWELLLHIYESTMPKTPFLDYFWSWRGLFGGLFSILLADLPHAKVYHSMCTGYAGLMLARASLETNRPCIVTEHGIYTNERRIEIASADWIDDPRGVNLAVSAGGRERDLKDLWIDTFGNYSRFCYDAADEIITLYEGNQEFQRMDGASARKMNVIPNGIDDAMYGSIERKPHPPTVALIGRVVPIKDIKTYIKAVQMLRQSVPDVVAYILGPADEDPAYARECRALVEHLQLEETVIFTGKVDVRDYFGIIDVNVLTSLSEAQPLVVLEAGAAGIPTVATDVGACHEMILGSSREDPHFGEGGAVVSLGSPQAVADALQRLLTDKDYYRNCSAAIRQRVSKFYSKKDQREAYATLYHKLIVQGEKAPQPEPEIEKEAA
ncbi:MAG: GT4 family glycosyltransferase PelF [Bdellovibrionales bacterium]